METTTVFSAKSKRSAGPFPVPAGNILLSPWVYRLIRLFFALVFIWSGTAKLAEPEAFAGIVDAYGLLPDPLIVPFAIFLPAFEVLAGLGILFDIRGSLSAICAMMVLFMGVLSYGIWLGLDIDCGCFGPEDPEAEAFHGMRMALVRDAVMMAGIAYLYAWRKIQGKGPRGWKAMVLIIKRRSFN